jgi:hypothetical protein
VGADWEAQNVGWNSSLDYDDSAGNGWSNAVYVAPPVHPSEIWADGDGSRGSTPAYFRKAFHLPGRPNSGSIDLVVDDDADVYVNGTLVFRDRDTLASSAKLDVIETLTPGFNLLAVKAHDAQGDEGLELTARINFTSFPDPADFLQSWSLSEDLVLSRD